MAQTPEGIILGTGSYEDMSNAGGGFITSFGISGSTKVCGTDTYGAYIWNADDTKWRQVITDEWLTDYDPFPADAIPNGSFGCSGSAIAPTDEDYVSYIFRGFWYFSIDGVRTPLVRSPLASKITYPNWGPGRYWNPRVAISGANKNHAMFGSSNNGAFGTTDFGANVFEIDVPDCLPFDIYTVPYLVAFGPDGRAYIFVQGVGLYTASSVSGTFTAFPTSGGPQWASNLVVSPNGAVFVTYSYEQKLYKYASGAWSSLATTGFTPKDVAVDSLDTNRVLMMDGGTGFIAQSLDNGATLDGVWQHTGGSPKLSVHSDTDDVAWIDEQNHLFVGQMQFDDAGELWIGHGIGVCKGTPPVSTVTMFDLYSRTKGIRQLVVNHFLSVPGKPGPLMSGWDKGTWPYQNDPSDQSIHHQYANHPTIDLEHSWQADYAIDDPDYIIDMRNLDGGASGNCAGVSTDGGETMSLLFPEGYPPGGSTIGGACAMSTKDQQILIPSRVGGRAICTDDRWATWGYLPLDPNNGSYWIENENARRYVFTSDKTRPGVFACVVSSLQSPTPHGLHVTTSGPRSGWTLKVAGSLDPYGDTTDSTDGILRYIPGRSGELLYTTGLRVGTPRLMHYANDGASGSGTALGSAWSVDTVQVFGFGKPWPGEDYPAIYFYGRVDGVMGLYVSKDFFATEPELVSLRPTGSFDQIIALSGDMNILDRHYLGFYGSGAAWWRQLDRRLGT